MADEVEEGAAAVGIELAHHIIEEEDRRLADILLQVKELRELQRECARTLLPLRAVAPEAHAADAQDEIVEMRPDARRRPRNIARTPLA